MSVLSTSMNSGVSGLLANAEALNVIANNISNVNTVGFKFGRALFSDTPYNNVSSNAQIGRGIEIGSVENIFGQGDSLASENPTDISIRGKGFFIVQNPVTSSTYYTRAGVFNVDENGKYLVNPDGMRLSDSTNASIDVSTFTNFDKITNVGLDGKISYLDTTGATQIATPVVGIATFSNEFGLEKVGDNNYKENLEVGGSGAVTFGAPTENSEIVGRSLEQSNVDIAAQIVNLITIQRAYSANSKVITTSDEITQVVINLMR